MSDEEEEAEEPKREDMVAKMGRLSWIARILDVSYATEQVKDDVSNVSGPRASAISTNQCLRCARFQ
jgi:hypothetical protein